MEIENDQEMAKEKMATDGEMAQPPTDEWTMAALAHASVLLTLVLGMAGGVGAVVGLLVPLAIYLGYRDRSRFVAFHALQALIYQAICIPAYLALAAILGIWIAAAWTMSGLLTVVLIGLLLMPIAALLTKLRSNATALIAVRGTLQPVPLERTPS